MSDARCVIGDKPHGAEVGYLCRPHYDRLSRSLRDVEEESVYLSAVPSMAMQSGNRGASLASHRAPARLDVIVANDPRRGTGIPAAGEPDPWGWDDTASVLDTLGSWARMVREERDLTPPDRVTVTGERDLLTRHLPWIAEQPWVDEFHNEIRALLGQLQASNGTLPEKPVGRCYLPVDGVICNGPIWLDLAHGHASCGRCHATWSGAQLAHLQWEMDRDRQEAARPRTVDGRPMKTAEELASAYKLKLPAVRKRLSRLGAKAEHGGYYDPDVFDVPRHSAEAS